MARFHPDGHMIYTGVKGGSSTSGTDPEHPAIWKADQGSFLSSIRREEKDASWDPQDSSELAVSPDGQRLAIGYQDGLVRLLSASGTPVTMLRGHASGAVRALAFTPDGRRLVSGSEDGTARVWDTRIGEEADFARGRWPKIPYLVYSPDGQIVAAAANSAVNGHGPVIAFRDAASGREKARAESPGFLSQPPLFSPDGRALLVDNRALLLKTSTPGLTLFDTASGSPLRTIELKATTGGSLGWAFSPDGRTVAIADGDGHLVEAATGRERLRFAGFQRHPIRDLRFSPDGTTVVSLSTSPGDPMSSSENISACLWDARDGRRLAVLKDSEANVGGFANGAVFSPDGRQLATAGGDATARIWEVATRRVRVVLRGHGSPVYSIAFTADGERVLTASGDGTARIWDAGSGRELARLVGHDGSVRSAAFTPDGSVILTYGDDRTVRLWGGIDGRPRCTLVRDGEPIHSAVFSPDGRLVVVSLGGQPTLTRTWPVEFLSAARAQCPRELTPAERARFELTAP